MNKIITWAIGIVAVLALILGSVALVGNQPVAPENLGASGTRFPNGIAVGTGASVATAGTFTVGSSGSALTNLIATSCNLVGTDGSQAASSTKAYDCAVTGLTSSFKVTAQLSTSTLLATGLGWTITSARASSTAGFATVNLLNLGAAAVPSAQNIGSSTSIIAWQ